MFPVFCPFTSRLTVFTAPTSPHFSCLHLWLVISGGFVLTWRILALFALAEALLVGAARPDINHGDKSGHGAAVCLLDFHTFYSHIKGPTWGRKGSVDSNKKRPVEKLDLKKGE